jgi:hypothetical protein
VIELEGKPIESIKEVFAVLFSFLFLLLCCCGIGCFCCKGFGVLCCLLLCCCNNVIEFFFSPDCEEEFLNKMRQRTHRKRKRGRIYFFLFFCRP